MLMEPSPREAALNREMRLLVNSTQLPWAGRRVVAAMTTTPARVAKIEATLDSLLRQTWRLDAIYLFIPWIFKRDGSEYVIPPWLPLKQGVTIVRCEDWGPSTHMMEALRRERDPHTYIFQVDDDQEYGPDLLLSLLRSSGPLPGRAVGSATQHAHTHIGGIVLEGVHGVLFQRKFFDPSVFQHEGFGRECWLHDDLWLSAQLARRAVHREQLGSRFGTRPTDYGFGEDALYRGGAGSDNTRNFYLCMSTLLALHRRLWVPETRVVVVAPLTLGEGLAQPALAGAEEAAAGLRALRALRRELGVGPHAVYTYGAVPSGYDAAAAVGDELQWPGGYVERLGSWEAPLDVIAQHCEAATCGIEVALDLALRFEEDPEALIVVLPQPAASVPGLHGLLRAHLRCQRARPPKSRDLCHGAAGSSSFWRHSAYDVDRIQGGVFMPAFSNAFHLGRAEGTHLPGQGQMWRDDGGPWRRAWERGLEFTKAVTKGDGDPAILHLMGEFEALGRRIVAAVFTDLSRLPHLGIVLRSLRLQQPSFRRIHLLVRAPREMRVCGPGWLRNRRGVVLHCGPGPRPRRLLALLAAETAPNTLLFLAGDGLRFGGGLLRHLVIATDIFSGSAVGTLGYSFGEHGGPVPALDSGVLLYRSFLDPSVAGLCAGPCRGELEMALAAHLVTKGIRCHVMGDSFGTRRLTRGQRRWQDRLGELSACREHLLGALPLLWVSRFPERCVLYVALLEGTTEFLLGLTLLYAGLQTRKPDEVVLLAMGGNPLTKQVTLQRSMATTTLEISASLGSGSATIRSQAGEELTGLSLVDWLASMRDRAGRLVRMQSAHGGARSFVLSVASLEPCPEGRCSVTPSLLRAFERELDPETALFFVSAERLVNERAVAEQLACVSACRPKCSRHSWCGQSATRADGAIYDLTLRRAAGYRDHVVT